MRLISLEKTGLFRHSPDVPLAGGSSAAADSPQWSLTDSGKLCCQSGWKSGKRASKRLCLPDPTRRLGFHFPALPFCFLGPNTFKLFVPPFAASKAAFVLLTKRLHEEREQERTAETSNFLCSVELGGAEEVQCMHFQPIPALLPPESAGHITI